MCIEGEKTFGFTNWFQVVKHSEVLPRVTGAAGCSFSDRSGFENKFKLNKA